MNKFLKKSLLFIFAIIIFLSPAFLVLKCTGECYTSNKPAIESDNDFLIGYAYSDDAYRFLKWYTINSKKEVNILTIGSSRATQFRENMFSDNFYNAGFTVFRINEFLPFLKSIPKEKYPKYIILCLDQWMFNYNFHDAISDILSCNYWSDEYISYPNIKTFIKVYKDILRGKYSFKVLTQNTSVKKVGLNAIINDFGIRNDGSLNYGNIITKLNKKDTISFDYAINKTIKGEDLFSWGSRVNPHALNVLVEILSFCKDNNINIIGFCPPLSDTIYNLMIESSNYKYLEILPEKLDSIFMIYNYEFFNYPTANSCNSNDYEFIDGFHGSELTYTRLLLNMLEKGSILNNFANIDSLKKDILIKKNNYIVY